MEMRYETAITLTYVVPVYSDKKLSRQEVLDYICENVVITEHKLIDVDYDEAWVVDSDGVKLDE